ncbi:MAG: histidine phosphatase family protein [Planctomycetota bacterium]|nr:histidine phosphatase family protein [Planctomycetota bacterium]
MPRRLIIMRHARSAWEGPGRDDHGRPLDERGRFEAPRVATRLVELGWAPQAIHSSDARRTRETAELMLDVLAPAPPLTLDPGFYLAGLPALRAAAETWDPSWSTVLALGHNPGWQDAASALCGSVLGMSTANAVLLEAPPRAPSGWSEALAREWSLVDVLRPGDH